LEIKS